MADRIELKDKVKHYSLPDKYLTHAGVFRLTVELCEAEANTQLPSLIEAAEKRGYKKGWDAATDCATDLRNEQSEIIEAATKPLKEENDKLKALLPTPHEAQKFADWLTNYSEEVDEAPPEWVISYFAKLAALAKQEEK